MSQPSLVACHFGPPRAQYARLARVLELSARRHCRGWSVHVAHVDPPPLPHSTGLSDSAVANTQKLDWWASRVAGMADGARVLLIDSDTAVLRPLDDAWTVDFDLALTARPPGSLLPYNAGVVFLRVSPRTWAFVAAWRQENARLLTCPSDMSRWRLRYGGTNQAALGSLLEGGIVERLGLKIARLSCAEWNCEESTWDSFGPETRILHLKSGLRRAILGEVPNLPKYRPMVRAWRMLDREAGA